MRNKGSGEAWGVYSCKLYNRSLIYILQIVGTVTGMSQEISLSLVCEWREMIKLYKTINREDFHLIWRYKWHTHYMVVSPLNKGNTVWSFHSDWMQWSFLGYELC
jgi:hypothetical protein